MSSSGGAGERGDPGSAGACEWDRATICPLVEQTMPNLKNGWTRGRIYGALLLTVVGVLAGIEAWRDILHIALRDEEASHVFLVPIVFVWLVWVRRRRLRHIQAQGSWIGPAMVLIGWALFDVGDA